MIGPRYNRKRVRTYNTELYKARPLIEYFFAKRLRITRYSFFTKKLGLKPRPSRTALISFITVKIY